ncbi:MAG: endonuclease/exonuclease/phosphatase family protein, partial [Myxococcales bacterium]|nr:endonuclease/exonuclease/phosphatase family protein [Myxococcales bacterium]
GQREEPVPVDAPVRTLDHELGAQLERWAGLRSRNALRRDRGYRRHQAEVGALLRGFAWDLRAARATQTARPGRLRAVSWNIERGKRWETLCGVLREHPQLTQADLILLNEVDLGMGRSDNRDVARELGQELGMGHVFATSHLVLAAGDVAELDHGRPNAQALHGVALLSRFPVRRVCGVGLPEYADKLGAVERRLGAKRALLAEVAAPGATLTVAVAHLDPFCPPRHRAWQLRRVIDALPGLDAGPVLLGGDLNTNTYDLGSPLRLGVDLSTKLLRSGFAGTVAHYMIADQHRERSVFEVLSRAGLRVDGFVDRDTGTFRYDLNDPECMDKTRRSVPRPVYRWLMRRLEPWGGTVPLRLDWFAGRDVEPLQAWTVDRPRYLGAHASDHDPIGVELRWPPGDPD